MNFSEKSVIFLATGCYAGKIPVAPGTFGSAVGLPLCYFLSRIDLRYSFVIILALIALSILIAHRAQRFFEKKDPGDIVIDEVSGIVVTFFGLPFDVYHVVFGFLLFRVMDIFKPYPIRLIDQRVSGGKGIVLDDVMAGVYANVATRILHQFLT
ncbi:MAG: phosphatidylglycerophosphatase A [Pseudomonadota bacterium]